MQLGDFLSFIEPESVRGFTDRAITGLAYDSRQVKPGFVFFALPGTRVDGHHFIPAALTAGATVIVTRSLDDLPDNAGACFVQVKNVRRTMAVAAAGYYGCPGRGIPIVGVTGTNGKTTVTYLIEAIMKSAGYSPAVFGTVSYRLGDRLCYEATHTTPESLELMKMLAEFRHQGADALIMEVSSHALKQHRVDGLTFDVAVFTNLTPEHLDYHTDQEEYFSSKSRLFKELLGAGVAVINADDPYGVRLLEGVPAALSFGMATACDLHPRHVQVTRDGISATFNDKGRDIPVKSPMIGDFNVSNLLAAVAAARQLGITDEQISAGISIAPQVPGRLERIENQRGVLALVDYAHTGDALEKALKTLKDIEHRRLYTLVGCGGDRDPGKRPLMAAAAVTYSDLAIFTSDNPRTEDPCAILEQIRQGALATGSRELDPVEVNEQSAGFVVIPDRRAAIDFAVGLAGNGDLLLVAGKGHENYQILGTRKIHFDDREELRRALLPTRAVNILGGSTDV